jgi:SAM-dependent methyltransferase
MRPLWDPRAEVWDQHLPASDLFSTLRDAVLLAADLGLRDVAIDLGAGSGFLTLPLAEQAARVVAVDKSPRMLDQLRFKLEGSEAAVQLIAQDLLAFTPSEKVDVIVSNYALHHLRHSAKRELLRRCNHWLRPGGRIVVSDLMVALTFRPGQSAALTRRLRSIAAKGIPGYWRIAKNGIRLVAGRGEYPADLDFWTRALREAAFLNVNGRQIGSESGVAWGIKARGSG